MLADGDVGAEMMAPDSPEAGEFGVLFLPSGPSALEKHGRFRRLRPDEY